MLTAGTGVLSRLDIDQVSTVVRGSYCAQVGLSEQYQVQKIEKKLHSQCR